MSFYIKKPKPRGADWNYGGSKWKLSRSKIDLFMQCKRCFYIDNKLGVKRPQMPSFTLNVAVDALLKKEFDTYRATKNSHPLMQTYKVDAVPFQHKDLDSWRENFVGVQYFHEPTGFTISGAVDDIWVNPQGELIVVDYKATAKETEIKSLDDSPWKVQYQRQLEIYQWILRKSGFKVSNIGYIVYVNGKADNEAFDGKLEFDVTLIELKGDDTWVEGTLHEIKECLSDDTIPPCNKDESCDHCNFINMIRDVLREQAKKNVKVVEETEEVETEVERGEDSKIKKTKQKVTRTKKVKEEKEDIIDKPRLFEL